MFYEVYFDLFYVCFAPLPYACEAGVMLLMMEETDQQNVCWRMLAAALS